jgi:F-type H+-transporting ATPase subunit delta
MKITRQARREAKRLFQCCLVEGRLDEARVRGAVKGLVEKKPRHYLPVLAALGRFVRLELERRRASVQSAVPLGSELERRVGANLERLYGAGLEIGFKQEAELIGGMRVQVGNDVYDGSVRARLERLQETF